MVTLLAFLAALAGAVFVADLVRLLTGRRMGRLSVQVEGEEQVEAPGPAPQASTWTAILGVLLPRWFDPSRAQSRERVVDLLRRSGYHPYGSVEQFYLAAMAEFGKGMVFAALAAAAFYMIHLRVLTLPVVAAVLFFAYNRPYSRLREAAKRRAELMRPNMLAGLAQLESLLHAGVGVQEALRRTAQLGGPFCNLMGLLVARLEVESPAQALERVKQHIPDVGDTNMILFLKDLEDYFLRQRPLDRSVAALRRSVHQEIVNATVARAAKVERTAGLFGVFAVIGMMISALAPVMGTMF